MINLVIDDPFVNLIEAQKLENAALATLNHENIPSDTDLSIVIDDDERLHALNKEFLGVDAPTDVLSFPSGEQEADPDSGHVYLGDIILSFPRASEQATTAGHPVMNELQLLVIHGVLHLLGYDHAEKEEKSHMWAVQAEILRGLDVQITRLPE